MARKTKPLEQLSPAYRKRIERGLKHGLSRSQSRGHARINRGEIQASELRKIRELPQTQTVLLRAVMRSGDPVERELYAKAAKEKFRKQTPWTDEKPSAMDELMTYRRGKYLLDNESEFQDYPGESFTNVQDINVFLTVLKRVKKYQLDDEESLEHIKTVESELEDQRERLIRENRVTPFRWGPAYPRQEALPKPRKKATKKKKSKKKKGDK